MTDPMTNNPAPVEHERIWLEPICNEHIPEGRHWCQHKLDDCDDPDCGEKSVEFIRADIAKARTDALRGALEPFAARAALSDAPQAAADEVVERLRRIAKGWADWYRFATRDDDNEYLNDKGWDDAEALADMTMTALAAMGDQP